MATDEPRRDKWRHPSGPWVPLPWRRMISAGVVRKINNTIREAEGS